MTEKEKLTQELNLLNAAYKGIETEKGNAEAERTIVDNAFRNIQKWKGTIWESIKGLELKKQYDTWIGGSGSGSIDGILIKISNTASAWQRRLWAIYGEESNQKICPPEDDKKE